MSAGGPHSSSQHGLAAVHNVQVHASPQKGAGAVCVQATPLVDSAGVAALHSASGCYSPQLPPRSKGSGHPIGSTVPLGAETNNQQDGRAIIKALLISLGSPELCTSGRSISTSDIIGFAKG